MPRRDIHVHFGDVDTAPKSPIDPYWNLRGDAKKAQQTLMGRRIHSTKPATIEELKKRIASEGLAQICLFCSDKEYLAQGIKELAGLAEIAPIYWERDWDHPNIPGFAKGIKIHPVIENRDATVENLRQVMDIAQERKIPVLFHTEDENPSRSNAQLMAKLAEAYPDVKIVALHSGAYGPPQLLQDEKYRGDLMTLVQDMIDAAVAHPNLYRETSCLAFQEKALLLFKATQAHPELLDRIVMGSDFPILEPYDALRHHNTFTQQERMLEAAGFSSEDIARFYDNVRKVAVPLSELEVHAVNALSNGRNDASHFRRTETEPLLRTWSM